MDAAAVECGPRRVGGASGSDAGGSDAGGSDAGGRSASGIGGGAAGGGPRALTPKRILAMLVLPASLLPVTLLGPGELNAPRRLARQAWAAGVRLERKLQPARDRVQPAPRLGAEISLGNVYGHWRTFPQIGREGLVHLGPMR
jgi:hypothetical protein